MRKQRIDESAKRKTELDKTERIMRGAKQRWLDSYNPFWKDFIYWVRYRVKAQSGSKSFKFAACCWCFEKRKQAGYEKHTNYVT